MIFRLDTWVCNNEWQCSTVLPFISIFLENDCLLPFIVAGSVIITRTKYAHWPGLCTYYFPVWSNWRCTCIYFQRRFGPLLDGGSSHRVALARLVEAARSKGLQRMMMDDNDDLDQLLMAQRQVRSPQGTDLSDILTDEALEKVQKKLFLGFNWKKYVRHVPFYDSFIRWGLYFSEFGTVMTWISLVTVHLSKYTRLPCAGTAYIWYDL